MLKSVTFFSGRLRQLLTGLAVMGLSLMLVTTIRAAGELEVDWVKTWGGSTTDRFSSIANTADNGYVAVGWSNSTNGDLTGLNNGGHDLVLVKFDVDGNLVWNKNFGGGSVDYFYSVATVSDGYVAVGWSNSTNGDLTGLSKGGYDAVIFKFDLNGNLVWNKNFGGTGTDLFNFVAPTADNGYLAAGYSNSTNGDMTGLSKGGYDAVIVKYDQGGNLLWFKNWGGSGTDNFNSVISTTDGYLVAGYTNSSNGDVGGLNKGGQDAILVKYDLSGNLLWSKIFGGSGNDRFNSIISTADGYLLAGYSDSSNDDLTGLSKGGIDALLVKYDQADNLLWTETYGGSGDDYFNNLTLTPDNGYLLAGYSNSTDLSSPNNGNNDAVLVTYDQMGSLIWAETYGGSGDDYFNAVLTTPTNNYVAAGYSDSSNGDLTGLSKGGIDATVFKLSEPVVDPCIDPANANLLSCQAVGTTITIAGQGGAEYKWIKLSLANDRNSYWMLADNYCALSNAPTICDVGNRQSWNPLADGSGKYGDWTTMSQTPGSVYQQVLQPLYNDLPAYIGGLPKNQAVLEGEFDMGAVPSVPGTGQIGYGACQLTAHSQANLTNCTWLDRVSLPGYTDWQFALRGYDYVAPTGSPPDEYCQTRFGTNCDAGGLFMSGSGTDPYFPWTRTADVGDFERVFLIRGENSGGNLLSSRADGPGGVSPVIFLSSALTIATPTSGQDGSYANPFELNTPEDFVFRVDNHDQDQTIKTGESLNIYGSVDVARAGRVEIRATIAGVEKVVTIVVNSGDPLTDIGYALVWQEAELPAGTYGGPTEPIVISVTFDSPATSLTANYTGVLTIGVEDLPSDSIVLLDLISNLLKVRYAGTIFVPETYQPGVHALLQDYSYHSTLDATHQVWTKQITHQLTSETKTYPFLVETFPLPTGDSVVGK